MEHLDLQEDIAEITLLKKILIFFDLHKEGEILSPSERSLNLLRSLPSRLDRDARMPAGAIKKLYVRNPIIRDEQDSIHHNQPNHYCDS